MRLVVTGASGFLGKNFISHVSNEITYLRLLDLHFPKTNYDLKCDYESHLIDLERPEVSEFINPDDIVIHLAWRSNPSVTGTDVNAELDLNWAPSKNLIDICARKRAKFIFMSSGGTVYGKPQYTPIDENHQTTPISAYGDVKLKVEEEILRSHSEHGLQYVILRPSNVYGPGFSTKGGLGVIGHWVEMIRENKPVMIIGQGEQVRDFLHVEDLCRAIVSCLRQKNVTLNVGTGNGVSLNQLAALLKVIVNREIGVVRVESRDFDVNNNVLSINNIQQLTGWHPRISLEDGIRKLVEEGT